MNYCNHCEENKATKICGQCFHVHYCSRTCQTEAWKYHRKCCYPLRRELYDNKNNTLLHKALAYNLFQEYQALKTTAKKSVFDKGRETLYEGVIDFIFMESKPTDDSFKNFISAYSLAKTKIINAGHLFHKDDSMGDPFVFSFIPEELHRDVDMLWHGIGSWKG